MNDNAVAVDRRHFLGGSDIAAVMGLSPWKTPVQLWLEKTGRIQEDAPDKARQRRLDRGKKLEPHIVDMAVDRLIEAGHTVEIVRRNERYQHPEYPFLRAEIDFEAIIDGEHMNGDCKSAHGFARGKWGDEGTDEVPIEYATQFMHGLMVTGRRCCLVAALVGLDDVALYWIYRDDAIIDGMLAKELRFWNECVVGGERPDVLDFSDIKALYPSDNGQAIEATEDIAEAVVALAGIKRDIRLLRAREDELTMQVGEYISPNALLTMGGATIATWKGQNHSSLRQKDLREAYPDIAEQFTKRQIVRVLRLKGDK